MPFNAIADALKRLARSSTPKRLRDRRGFTLMELMVVLLIIAAITAIAVPMYMNRLAKARVQTASIQVQQLGTILDMYRLDVGHYPTSSDGLESLVTAPAGVDRWGGPYLKQKESLTDPWGNPYQYRSPGDHGDYDLWSNGADGTEGGDGEDADITSW